MDAAEEAVLWSLAHGQTSAPFIDRFGFDIVRVEGRRVLPLNDVRGMVVGDLKFAADKRRQHEIINAAHVALKKVYMSSPLPCPQLTQRSTLKQEPGLH